MDIAIRDLTPTGGLSFDLAELVAVLGPQARDAWWRVRGPVSYTSDAGIEAFDITEHRTGPWIAGSEFLQQVRGLIQVIDGVFELTLGRSSDLAEPWVTFRAVDSSWWEVYTDDADLLARVRSTFRDIQPARYTASSVY